MDSADSAVSAILLRLTSPQVLGAVLALLLAGVIALLVARALRVRRAPGATAAQQRPHWLDHTLEGALILAPLVAALATLLAGRAALAAFATSTAVIDGALEIVGALVLLRFGVYLLGRMLGPGSWVGTRENRITFVLWVIAGVALLGWLDALEAALNRVSLLPGRTQLSLWGLLKGLVIVTAFLVVTSLIARAIRLVTTRKAVTITRPLSRPHRLNCVRPGSRLTRLRAASSASSQPSSATPAITHKTNVMRFSRVPTQEPGPSIRPSR